MLVLPPPFLACAALLAFVVGACVASFINCAALRRSTGESVLTGRSHCPHCKATLGATELIPIISWFMLGKKCKHCGASLSVRYPLTELIGGLSFAAIVWADGTWGQGLSLHTLHWLIFAGILLYASLVDIDSRTIPDGCILAAIAVRVIYIVLAGPVLGQIDGAVVAAESLIGGFAIAIPLRVVVLVADRVLGRDSMGGGDIKLFFVAGLYFGWRACLFLIMIACFIGIVAALFSQRKELKALEERTSVLEEVGFDGEAEELSLRHQPITFGPAIAAACVIIMLIGQPLVNWYGGLF